MADSSPATKEAQPEKVYVAVGSDLRDGFATLEWAIQKWPSPSSPPPISIVILYPRKQTASKDFVYTPFGKLPASAVSDEVLRRSEKYEQEKTARLMSQYIAYCGQAKAETLVIETSDEPIHKVMIDLISKLRITELVMSISFMKASSWKTKSAISGSFYIHRQRPSFCNLRIVCGGKLLFLGEENKEGAIKDDQEAMAAETRDKQQSGAQLGETCANKHTSSFPINSQWESSVGEIDCYYKQLLSSNVVGEPDEEIARCPTSPTSKADSPDDTDSKTNIAGRVEGLRMKIRRANETIQPDGGQAKSYVERQTKAAWAISLCNQRVVEHEACINDEMTIRMGLEKELDCTKEELNEVFGDVEEAKSRLSSIAELQSELSSKLQLSSVAKSHAEAQLEKAATTRAEMVRQIEELRRQRDVLHRRIEFCKDKHAIGKVTRMDNMGCRYREFTAQEVILATDNFSERLRLKSDGGWMNVYKGKINHTTVAIKLLDSVNGLSQEALRAKVTLLSSLQHPHLITVIGFCLEPSCVVFEYMHSGSLRDIMLTSWKNPKRRNRALHWRHCIRIAAEVCMGLSFLHLAEPRSIALGNLNPSNILLGRNLVAKIHCFTATRCYDKGQMQLDVHAFGQLVLQLLVGKDWTWPGILEEAVATRLGALSQVLNVVSGEWPLDLAQEFAQIGLRCLCEGQGTGSDFRISKVMEEISALRKKVANIGREALTERCASMEETSNIPSVFLCPIYQEVMRDPHVAADGLSYELEAMEEWIRQGHDTSPMTNLKLKHTNLTPNHILRSLIQDWHSTRSISVPN